MIEENNTLGDPEPPGDGTTSSTQTSDPASATDEAVSAYSDAGDASTNLAATGDPEPPGNTGDPEPPGGSTTGSGSGGTT
jgi:hypothetical protein